MSRIYIPVSIGELFDKITILSIKSEKINDANKLFNVCKELVLLDEIAKKLDSTYLENHYFIALKSINEDLWHIENAKRECERLEQFDNHFIGLARSVYLKNDERACIKAEINKEYGSEIFEVKEHQ